MSALQGFEKGTREREKAGSGGAGLLLRCELVLHVPLKNQERGSSRRGCEDEASQDEASQGGAPKRSETTEISMGTNLEFSQPLSLQPLLGRAQVRVTEVHWGQPKS